MRTGRTGQSFGDGDQGTKILRKEEDISSPFHLGVKEIIKGVSSQLGRRLFKGHVKLSNRAFKCREVSSLAPIHQRRAHCGHLSWAH